MTHCFHFHVLSVVSHSRASGEHRTHNFQANSLAHYPLDYQGTQFEFKNLFKTTKTVWKFAKFFFISVANYNFSFWKCKIISFKWLTRLVLQQLIRFSSVWGLISAMASRILVFKSSIVMFTHINSNLNI